MKKLKVLNGIKDKDLLTIAKILRMDPTQDYNKALLNLRSEGKLMGKLGSVRMLHRRQIHSERNRKPNTGWKKQKKKESRVNTLKSNDRDDDCNKNSMKLPFNIWGK